MLKVNFTEYQKAKNEILFGKNFKEYSELKENGIITKEYCAEDGQNFYEINDNGRIEFWSTKHSDSRIYDESTKMEEVKTEVLGVDCYQVAENTFEIRLINGQIITVKKDVEHNGSIWEWKIDTQIFSKNEYAENYLKKLIAEKLTGIRIIDHKKGSIPEICGIEGKACRHPKECNTMLCSHCPIAEQFFAERNNVKLIYAVN
jgi:hypothetical protein